MIDTSKLIDQVKLAFAGTNIKVVNTLETDTPVYNGWRRKGNTTRQIDWAIQKLFEDCAVICLDHYMNGCYSKANLDMMKSIHRRLIMEHQIPNKYINIDKNRYVILLKYT